MSCLGRIAKHGSKTHKSHLTWSPGTGETIASKRFSTIASFSQGPIRSCNVRRRNAKLPSVVSSSSSALSSSQQLQQRSLAHSTKLPYGLKRVDYTQGPGPKWSLPPPPPPHKNPLRRIFPFAQFAAAAALFYTIWTEWDESVIDYWRDVEYGETLPFEGEDLEEDDDDLEDLDDDVDEWADEGSGSSSK